MFVLWALILRGQQASEVARDLTQHFACAACHEAAPDRHLPPRRGPVLDGVGNRLKASWIRRFLTEPQGSAMPDLLAHLSENKRAETIENLTAFLTQDAKPTGLPRFSDPVNGKRLYETIGCAVCHEETEPKHTDKYHFGGLASFLGDPLATHPDGRMPSLSLRAEEAGDLAHFLLPNYQHEGIAAVKAEQVEAGRQAFEKWNCAACHPRNGFQATSATTSLANLTSLDCQGPPHYALTPDQRDGLSEFHSVARFTPESELAARLRSLNCQACHQREGQGGPSTLTHHLFTGDDTLGNEGRYPPHLDGVGRKLTSSWLSKVFAGQGAVRPYLNIRMPVFGVAQTDRLTKLFALVDGAPSEAPNIQGDVQAGHQLMGVDGGMGCITCHGWGPNVGVAMHGLNLSSTSERLRFDWFKSSLINPQMIRPGTLMPSFWPDGQSGNPNILAGDTDQQIAALWEFLREGTQTPRGFPDPGSGRFEILPKDKPIVQRGFIHPGGTSAIAVGFPDGIHFIYDGKSGNAVGGWRGRFLDGYKLWFSRLDPTAKPLGGSWHVFESKDEWPSPLRFKGYRIDPESGVPTFLLQAGTIQWEDTLIPLPDAAGFERTLRELGDTNNLFSCQYRW